MPSLIRFGAALIAAVVMTGSAEAASVGDCGGSGGSQSKTLSCPAGHYIVGLSVRGDAFIDRIGIRCAKIDSEGKRGKLGAFQYAGGTGGTDSQSANCPGSRALTTVNTKAGSYIDKVVNGFCRVREAQGGFNEQTAAGFSFNLVGGTGGTFCRLRCSEGEAMHKLIVRYGAWVDSIEAFCRP